MDTIAGGTLSKVVPKHTRTIKFRWCKHDFKLFGAFRAVRERSQGLKEFDKCFWCKKPFEDADMMALAQPVKGGNKVLCQSCAAQLVFQTSDAPVKP